VSYTLLYSNFIFAWLNLSELIMYYRRKILLSLLDAFERKQSNVNFQKILFLFTKMQQTPSFYFVPYKFGPFSFQSYQDKRTMTKYKLLSGNSYWEKNNNINYFDELTKSDQEILTTVQKKFSGFTNTELIYYVYSNYPEYTINSEIKFKYPLRKRLIKEDNSYNFFTIGYEGHTIDSYVYILIKNNIKLLCDVRKNPVSMKYGFSKNQLKNILEKLGIEYLHMPELGIESGKRKNLNTPDDYKRLFADYSNNILPIKKEYIEQLINIFLEKRRIAITCFESDYKSCHRHKITEYLLSQDIRDYKIEHV